MSDRNAIDDGASSDTLAEYCQYHHSITKAATRAPIKRFLFIQMIRSYITLTECWKPFRISEEG